MISDNRKESTKLISALIEKEGNLTNVAKRLGVTHSIISMILSGKRTLSEDMRKKIAKNYPEFYKLVLEYHQAQLD